MADLTKYMSKTFTFHRVKIEEIENGLKITETFDSDIVESFISFNARPFFRSTNETDAETYQVLDVVGEIYNIPALATDFILIDLKGTIFIPGNATELIEYSVKLKPFRSFYEQDAVLSIGEITADSSTVTVELSSTGKNSVRINGSIYDRYILSDFPFIPIVEFTKILIVYAKPDSTVFYLAQGVEALSAVEPDYDGLFVARLIVSVSGIVIEEGGNNGDVLVKNGNSQEWSPRLTEAEQGISSALSTISGIQDELVTIETRLDDLDDNDESLQEQITAETTARQNADNAESNARTFADGVLDGKITTEKNRNNAQDAEINFLKNKPQLISTDDSILIEENDIGAMLSFFYEEFSNQDILLSFTPMVILGVYKNGLLLNDDEFILVLPKNIVINNYTTNDKIKIQYQHLKTDLYEYNISN